MLAGSRATVELLAAEKTVDGADGKSESSESKETKTSVSVGGSMAVQVGKHFWSIPASDRCFSMSPSVTSFVCADFLLRARSGHVSSNSGVSFGESLHALTAVSLSCCCRMEAMTTDLPSELIFLVGLAL